MATVYWLTETGEAEPQPVCTVDFADEGTAVDFAHQLYRSVHGFARSRQGFVIRGEDGEALYTWQWTGEPHDDEAADAPEAGRPAPAAAAREAPPPVRPRAPHRLDRPYPDLHRMLRPRLVQYRQAASELIRRAPPPIVAAPLRWPSRVRGEVSRLLRACAARFRAVGNRLPAVWRRLTRWERPIRPADPKRFPPDVRPKVRRWRPEIDHYLLAIIVALGVLCGSPLASIYSTVQRFTRDEAVVRRDGSAAAAAAATRDAAKSTLSTDGKIDFRKLFWHLRVVGPTEIHLLTYDPADGDGPRMIFETRDLVRWRLHSVRGADGTWWAKAGTWQHAS